MRRYLAAYRFHCAMSRSQQNNFIKQITVHLFRLKIYFFPLEGYLKGQKIEERRIEDRTIISPQGTIYIHLHIEFTE